MGKTITSIFAERIVKTIQHYEMHANTFCIPDRFKMSWFEMSHNNFECKAKECVMEQDGLWKDNKGRKFWWRIEPNYCTAGRPSYGSDREEEIWKKTETKKVLINMLKSQVCLELNPFLPPTATCWGLRFNSYRVTIYEHGKLIYNVLPRKRLEETPSGIHRKTLYVGKRPQIRSKHRNI